MKILTVIFLFVAQFVSAQSFTESWCSEKIFEIPESVFYNAESNKLYISNIAGKPSEKNGQGFISLMNPDGKMVERKWIVGLNAPKGMAVRDGKLYVTDIDRIAVADIEKGKIIRFIDIPGSMFLNDLVFDEQGNLYISDTPAGVVYKYSVNHADKWLTDENLIKIPNGMAYENGNILIGTGNGIVAADPESGKATLVISHEGAIDGLIPIGKSRYIISDWAGTTQLLSKGKAPVVLRNTIAEKINAADLGYIPQSGIVLIPTFYNNRVCAFSLNLE